MFEFADFYAKIIFLSIPILILLDMAHVRKDTLTKCLQWWKHLKDFKRPQNKRERRAAKKEILKDLK
jgi:hypothetical protein